MRSLSFYEIKIFFRRMKYLPMEEPTHKKEKNMSSLLDTTKERDRHIEQRLFNDQVIWLITVRPDGRPHAVVVGFLWTGDTVLILTLPTTQKVRNLHHNPNVVLALNTTDNGDDQITIEGIATLPSVDELRAILPAFVEKYSYRLEGTGTTSEQQIQIRQAILITPTRLM
jgi:PPOX class probable F420-dependent enzyme